MTTYRLTFRHHVPMVMVAEEDLPSDGSQPEILARRETTIAELQIKLDAPTQERNGAEWRTVISGVSVVNPADQYNKEIGRRKALANLSTMVGSPELKRTLWKMYAERKGGV